MIGGDTKAILQVSTTTKNEIGEQVKAWVDVPVMMPERKEPGLFGWLDYRSGEANYATYNAKIQESSHVFICDYVQIPATIVVNGKNVSINVENARMMIDSKQYDVKLMDDPMGLHQHLEFFLDYTGGQ